MKNTALTSVRRQLDEIDGHILELIADRCAIIQDIAAIKQQHNLSIRDSAREKALLAKLQRVAVEHHQLNPRFVQQLFTLIIEESVRLQQTQNNEPPHPEPLTTDKS